MKHFKQSMDLSDINTVSGVVLNICFYNGSDKCIFAVVIMVALPVVWKTMVFV